MKIPSCLTKSRHGVYYFRIQFQASSKRKERRFSLTTKCPIIAKAKAVQISAIIAQRKLSSTDMAPSFKFNPNDPSTFGDLLKNADQYKQFDVELPGGIAIRNINTQADIDGALAILKQMNANVSQNLAPPAQPQESTVITPPIQGGATINEMIERFATRKNTDLSKKSLYEYRAYQEKFSVWMSTRKKNKAFPISLVSLDDISCYIEDLKIRDNKGKEGLSPRTIQNKYLSALGGLFELAQSCGCYPKVNRPGFRGGCLV